MCNFPKFDKYACVLIFYYFAIDTKSSKRKNF